MKYGGGGGGGGGGGDLFIECLVVFEERFECLEDFDLRGDGASCILPVRNTTRTHLLPLHNCHAQRTLVTRHQRLQMLQQQLHACLHVLTRKWSSGTCKLQVWLL